MSWIEGIFRRYGGITVLFARFFNILRQLNGIVAGTLEMPWWRFLFFNAAGAALWVAAWVAAGAFFGEHLKDVARLAHHTWLLVPVLAAACLILFLLFARKKPR
jgi:membrane protein DedA with SNARE-associated domain